MKSDSYSLGKTLSEVFPETKSRQFSFSRNKSDSVNKELIDLVGLLLNPEPDIRPNFDSIIEKLVAIHNISKLQLVEVKKSWSESLFPSKVYDFVRCLPFHCSFSM